GTKACDDAGKARMETVPGKDYILLPLWNADPPFSQSSKSSPDVGFKPSGDDEKKMKTVNGEVQLQALVDGKKIIVTEASVRRDLQLNDEEGTDCLPNATIFEELTRMGLLHGMNLVALWLLQSSA
ncbi:hypothetical protein Tco_1308632, partial [Tanacetum coccineum]